MAGLLSALFGGNDPVPPPAKPKLATPQEAFNPQKLLHDYNVLFSQQQQAIYLLKLGKVEILNKLLDKLVVEISKNVEFVRPVKRDKLKVFLSDLLNLLEPAINPPNKSYGFVPDSEKMRLLNEVRAILGLQKLLDEDLIATIDEKAYLDKIDYYFRPYKIVQLWNYMTTPTPAPAKK